MDNVALENLDQHLDNGGVQQLHVLIKNLKYHITEVEYLLNYSGENEATSNVNPEKIRTFNYVFVAIN